MSEARRRAARRWGLKPFHPADVCPSCGAPCEKADDGTRFCWNCGLGWAPLNSPAGEEIRRRFGGDKA